ncbi:MAG: Spy/CpxP family protein refolding chaperone [Burkholderiaceae bacterium]
MNRLKKNVVIGMTALGIGLGSVAFAAPDSQAQASGPQDKPARMHKHDPAKFKERMEKRQAELHDKLKLTANQEAAWKTFTASMTPAVGHAKRPDRAEMEKLTAPERMEKMLERSKQRQDAMASRLTAVKKFYAQLTPEQQKVFDESFAKPHRFGHHGHRGQHHERS